MARAGVAVALGLILLLAGVYRLININWDDSQHLHPDERYLTMVVTGIQLPSSIGDYFDTAGSSLNPENRGYDNFVYGTFPIFTVKALADLTGLDGYDEVTLLGRALSALMDLVSIFLLFVVGRRLYGTRVALLGSLLLACAVTGIQQSHFFTVDTFTNVPVLLAMLGAILITEGAGLPAFLLAGAAFGLSVAGRINMAPFAAIIALAGGLRFARALGDYSLSFAGNSSADSPGSPRFDHPNGGMMLLRTLELGPLSIDILRRPETAPRSGDSPPIKVTEAVAQPFAGLWAPLFSTLLGLLIAATASILVYRIAQPYAFSGLFSLNPKFTHTMSFIGDLVGGNIDYPPSHQWTDTIPYAFPFYNMVWWGLGVPFGFAAAIGFVLAGYELIRHRKWQHLLVFFWVGGEFLYYGQQFAKTLRYFYPIIPFLALLAAYLLFWLWDRAQRLRLDRPRLGSAARIGALAVAVVVIGYTLFYATAWIHIYQQPVTRVAATRWIYGHIPCGSTVGNERWDDPLPLRLDGRDGFGGCYVGIDFENYAEDDDGKRQQMIGWIDSADYIFISSNRLYVSIPRLPLRYPLTTKYYQWLFDGTLGFDLAAEFTSYPQLGPFVVNDDNAEEIFKNYEHPKVLLFKKSARYSHDKLVQLLNSVDLTQTIKYWPKQATASRHASMMPPDEAATQRSGGTWLDIYHPDSLMNAFPVPAWILTLELLGLLAFPITSILFRGFADRGYALTKTLGLLLPAWGAWTLASYHALPFSQETILAVIGVMALAGLSLAWHTRRDLGAFMRHRWRVLLIEEALWLAFFTFFLLIRTGNPDLWHPWYGGEKPMDFAFLNAVTKSSYFPPFDPWFAGGYLNYYYFGQLISATLLRLTGIVPEVGYNLLLPMFYAMLTVGAFTVAFNLAAKGRLFSPSRSVPGQIHLAPVPSRQLRGDVPDASAAEPRWGEEETAPRLTRALAAGLFAALLVGIIGNLGEVRLVLDNISNLGAEGVRSSIPGLGAFASLLSGLGHMLAQGKWFDIPIGWYFWNATRTIPDTINEFPFFTFLYADLHAHLMALPFTVMALALAVHAILLRARLGLFDLALSALVVGSLRAINTWDYPTYVVMLGAGIVIGHFAVEHEASAEGRNLIEKLLLLAGVGFVQVVLIIVPAGLVQFQFTLDLAAYILVMLFALALGFVRMRDRFDMLAVFQGIGWRLALLISLAIAFYAPFIAAYGTAYNTLELWMGAKTTLPEYITVHGVFLFLVSSFLLVQTWRLARRQGTFRALEVLVTRPSRFGRFLRLSGQLSPAFNQGLEMSAYFVLPLLLIELGLVFLRQPIVALVLPLVVLASLLLLRSETAPVTRFLSLVILTAIVMTVMVEFIVLKGDVGRMNTVFKFYLQVWVMLSVAGAAGLALVIDPLRRRLDLARTAWWTALALLLAGGMLYPVLATWAKVNDRYPIGNTALLRPTLNGMEYMKMAQYDDKDRTLTLVNDYEAIQWLRRNVHGSPVVAEANAPLYHWGSRISIYTGLPTIIGWDWHEKQQRSLVPGEIIDKRLQDVSDLFSSADPIVAAQIIRRYDVSYIFVGEEERAFYPDSGLSKFDAMTQAGLLETVYDKGPVKIYHVKGS